MSQFMNLGFHSFHLVMNTTTLGHFYGLLIQSTSTHFKVAIVFKAYFHFILKMYSVD